jgi:hypothetical protein
MTKLCMVFLLFFSIQVCGDPVSIKMIGSFSTESLDAWETIKFNSETTYRLIKNESGMVLLSNSATSASGLINKQKIDIKKYPYLNWRWQASKKLSPMNEQTKEGDDYVARIYVLVSDGWFFWNTKALNYVWSSQADSDAIWPNAYAPDNARMIALRTSKDATDIWYEEKRNIYQDLKEWLGKGFKEIEAIAIMTDTDDSASSAAAMYGDIYFSSE